MIDMKCDKCEWEIQGSHVHVPDGRNLCFKCDAKEIDEDENNRKNR